MADPVAQVVQLAHDKNIQVVPLAGPSAILMAMMSSGLNGQNFAFNGYLPIDLPEMKKEIRMLEELSRKKNRSQIFIETPYRNQKLFQQLITVLSPETKLCIATDITLPSEFIKTMTVKKWKHETVDLQKRPTVFILHRD